MLSSINRLSAQILIEADLREEGCPDETRPMEVRQALDSIQSLAGTPKDWEWDLGLTRVGFRHGSFYIRDETPEEDAARRALARIAGYWERTL